jgi:hypothetical protein
MSGEADSMQTQVQQWQELESVQKSFNPSLLLLSGGVAVAGRLYPQCT